MGCNVKTVQVLHIRNRVSKSRKDPDVWFGSTGHQELDDSVKSDLQSEDKNFAEVESPRCGTSGDFSSWRCTNQVLWVLSS